MACLVGASLYGQSPFDAFHYQGYLNETNNSLYETNTSATFSLYRGANKEELIYQEEKTISVDNLGYFSAQIGSGSPSILGTFSSLSAVNWSASNFYYLNIEIDSKQIEYVRIMSVPFAMISQKTLQTFSLNELTDVDTSGINENDVLKWDGDKWRPSPDLFYDTIPYADSTMFAIRADTAKYADTAFVALQSKNAWQIFGNSNTNPNNHFIGTTDNTALHLVTNEQKRLTILPNGNVGVGTENPTSDLHLVGNNGVLFEGEIGVGTIPIEGEGTRMMWYPAKGAFRVGTLEAARANFWNNSNIGSHSFASGKNVLARGDFSAAFGELSQASGSHSMAIGFNSLTDVGAPYSLAVGHISRTRAPYAIAMGRACIASGEASIAMGYHITARGNYSGAFGYYSQTSSDNAFAFGHKAIAQHEGAFLFADRSSNNDFLSTADNQFAARVIGGAVFYTSADLSSGVVLPPGSGSWSTLSDSASKMNIFKIDETEILSKLNQINVYEWKYKNEKNATHIGPMSQSFYSTFGYGGNNKYISAVDIDGVNLAAAKALYIKSIEIEKVLNDYDSLLKKYKQLEKEKQLLEKRLSAIEQQLSSR